MIKLAVDMTQMSSVVELGPLRRWRAMIMRKLRDGFVEQSDLWEVCLFDLTAEAQAWVFAG